jgi:hypothetical protein
MTSEIGPGRVTWLLCSAVSNSSSSSFESSSLSLFSDEETPSALLAQAEKEDAGGGRLRRVFQRHSIAANSLPGELKALVAVHLAARASLGYEDSGACKSCLANLLLATHGEELSIVKRLVDFPYLYVLAAAESIDGGAGLSSLPRPQGVEEIDMLALTGLLPLPTQAHFVQHVHAESEVTLAKWISTSKGKRGAVVVEQDSKEDIVNEDDNNGIGNVNYRTKIYCDWDDTVRASLFDCSFPRNTVYPGFISFIQSLRGEFDSDYNVNVVVDSSSSSNGNTCEGSDDVSTVLVGGIKRDQQSNEEGNDEEKKAKGVKLFNDKDKNDTDTVTGSITETISSNIQKDFSSSLSNSSSVPLSGTSSDRSDRSVDHAAVLPAPLISTLTPERRVNKTHNAKVRGAGQLIDTTNTYLPLGLSSSTSSSSSSSSSWWNGLFGSTSSSTSTFPPSSSSFSPHQSTPPRQPRMVPLSPLPVVVSPQTSSLETSSASPQINCQTTPSSSSSSPEQTSASSSSSSPQQPPQLFSPPASSAWPGKVMRLVERGVVAATKVLLHSSSPSSSSPSSSSSLSYSSSVTSSLSNTSHLASSSSSIYQQKSVGTLTQADLVFISARPRFLRSQTLKHAQGIGVGHAAILTGTISAALSHDRLAARKLLNHLRHWTLFREYRVLFIGDSGQADVSAALQILSSHEKFEKENNEKKGGKDTVSSSSSSSSSLSPISQQRVRVPPPLCLIHDIRNSSQEPRTSASQRADLLTEGVHVFDSYIDAAYICFKHGLITAKGLKQVIDTATNDLSNVMFTDEKMKSSRLEEYNNAVKRTQMG